MSDMQVFPPSVFGVFSGKTEDPSNQSSNMPTRQMKENSDQPPHLVIRTHLQNSMNPPQKQLKSAQNGKGPPKQDSPGFKLPAAQTSPPPQSKNRSRRRGRGGRKSDLGEICTRPSSRPCTAADKPVASDHLAVAIVSRTPNGFSENGASTNFQTTAKSCNFAPRPGYGQLGTRCIVKANHFLTALPQKDLNQYDVSSKKHVFSSIICLFFNLTGIY